MQTFDSIFDAISDTPIQATNLKLRAELLHDIQTKLHGLNQTQRSMATICDITQPRLNDLLQGKLDKFSLDSLVNIHAKVDTYLSGQSNLHFAFA